MSSCAGGQKIIRCELSIDDAKSWRLAEIKRIQQKPNKGGKYWAWVFWEISVPTGLPFPQLLSPGCRLPYSSVLANKHCRNREWHRIDKLNTSPPPTPFPPCAVPVRSASRSGATAVACLSQGWCVQSSCCRPRRSAAGRGRPT